MLPSLIAKNYFCNLLYSYLPLVVMLKNHHHFLGSAAEFSFKGDFAPQGTWAMSGDPSDCHSLRGGEGATDIE